MKKEKNKIKQSDKSIENASEGHVKKREKKISIRIVEVVVVILALTVVVILGVKLGNGDKLIGSKEITVDGFIEDMKDSGLTVVDDSAAVDIESFNIEVLKVAYTENQYRVEFYDMNTVNDAQDMFDISRIGIEGYTGEYEIEQEYIGDETVQEAIDADAENMITVDRGDCTFYYIDSDDELCYLLAKRDDKFIYGVCSTEYETEFLGIMDKAGIQLDDGYESSRENALDTEE